MSDPVEDAIRQVHATREHRDQLQRQIDQDDKLIAVQGAEIDRLNLTITQLSAERDHYMVQCATLKNDLGNVQTIIAETVRKAREVSFGRIARESTAQIEDRREPE